jgi:hypothetical protein
VDSDANPALREHGLALADAITAAVPGWVRRCVERVAGPGLDAEAAAAGEDAAVELAPRLRDLLGADVDEQRVNPLALVRTAVSHPTAVLAAAGVPRPHRPPFEEEHFPDDPYGLTPMTWRDVDESLHEPGVVWGALKARAHAARHGRGA